MIRPLTRLGSPHGSCLLVSGSISLPFRRRQLAPQRPIRSLLSRESLVLTTTYLLLVFTAFPLHTWEFQIGQ